MGRRQSPCRRGGSVVKPFMPRALHPLRTHVHTYLRAGAEDELVLLHGGGGEVVDHGEGQPARHHGLHDAPRGVHAGEPVFFGGGGVGGCWIGIGALVGWLVDRGTVVAHPRGGPNLNHNPTPTNLASTLMMSMMGLSALSLASSASDSVPSTVTA